MRPIGSTVALFLLLLLLFLGPCLGEPLRPYVTCVGCDTFLQCFLRCPRAKYPGINR